MSRAVLGLVLSGALSACISVPALSEGPFACETDGDCADGYVCVEQICTGAGEAEFCGGTPRTLVPGQDQPHSLVVRDGYLYWANFDEGAVYRMRLAFGERPQLIASAAGEAGMLALTDTHVYWGTFNGFSVWRRLLDGSGGNESIASTQDHPLSLAVNGTHVFWTNFGSSEDVGTIGRATLTGGSPGDLAQTLPRPRVLGLTSTKVIWIDNVDFTGRVASMALSGGMITDLATSQRAPATMTIDGSYVYWTTADGYVRRVPVSSGAVDEIENLGDEAMLGLVVLEGWVYWSSTTANNIRRKHADGTGALEVLVSDEPGAESLAFDAECMYWTTDTAIRVKRRP